MDAAERLAAARAAAKRRRDAIQGFAFDARIERRSRDAGGAMTTWGCIKTITFNGESIRCDEVADRAPAPESAPRPTESATTVWAEGVRMRFQWNRVPNELWLAREELAAALHSDPLCAAMRLDFLELEEASPAPDPRADWSSLLTVGVPMKGGGRRIWGIDPQEDHTIAHMTTVDALGKVVGDLSFGYESPPGGEWVLRSAEGWEGAEGPAGRTDLRIDVYRVALNPVSPRSYFMIELPRGTAIVDEDSGERFTAEATIDAHGWIRQRDREGGGGVSR